LKLLIVAVMTWAACAAYMLWLNPEIRFYNQLAAVQDAWSQKMDREYGRKVVVFGGSSCMFSIVGEQMLESYDLPTVNRGLAAGMRAKIPALNAIHDLRRGDTLIVALEPGLLTVRAEPSSLAAEFSYVRGHSEWATRSALGLPGVGRASALLALRPGCSHVLTFIAKIVQGRELYRYKMADASPSGWMRTKVRVPVSDPPGHDPLLSNDTRQFLSALRVWCGERGVRVAYSLPWGYAPAEQVEAFRKDNLSMLLQIAEFIPIIKDTWLGADTNAGHFADSAWHLNEEGSRLRTDELGRAVQQWSVWSLQELQQIGIGGR